jgi:catechol 2,3-dioxygenase-like lactoylglutathione lyase family enzyme
MYSHIFTSVTDFDRAFAFYAPLLSTLGLTLRFHEPDRPWAGWQVPGQARPLFVICKPHDGRPHDPGNGQMVAFAAASRAMVRAAHAAGLAAGGTCEGPPGLRPHYHAHYYGAYLRDPEGNKVGLACHTEGE